MASAAKKKIEPERTPADLAAQVARLHAEIIAYIDKRVAEVKLSCPGLPVQVIRQDLIKGRCTCLAGLGLIEQSGVEIKWS
jgi:hypothetical protein